LPIAVTSTLTIIASRMADAKILCKTLATVETLGAVTVICSVRRAVLALAVQVRERTAAQDMTGTLTHKRMTVKEAAFIDAVVQVDEHTGEKPTPALIALAAISGLCNDAQFEIAATKTGDEKAMRKVNGDETGACQRCSSDVKVSEAAHRHGSPSLLRRHVAHLAHSLSLA
jgi:sodium/potassium-transporting ATPase subunit alpha